METCRNRNNLLYLQNTSLKMYCVQMLFLHFCLPTLQSLGWKSLIPLICIQFCWPWCGPRKPLCICPWSPSIVSNGTTQVYRTCLLKICLYQIVPKACPSTLYLLVHSVLELLAVGLSNSTSQYLSKRVKDKD